VTLLVHAAMFKVGLGAFAVVEIEFLAGAIGPVTGEGQVDKAFHTGDFAVYDGLVFFINFAVLK